MASASCSACCAPTGKCAEMTAIKFAALCGFPSFFRRVEHANCKLLAFHTTSASIAGARRSLTVSLQLMRRSSYTTAFAGSLREEAKEERMFEDMMLVTTVLIFSRIPRVFRWGHVTDGSGYLCAICYYSYYITNIQYCGSYIHVCVFHPSSLKSLNYPHILIGF